ncbi:rhodanese-like domain-containing protein [Acidocella sp.]|jgi:rhodanese-related sulfurtransferase|uniref:rhodanese-like domain-containing protein n=1 Tax=Acidocella sp. TaxID=50710 RepID=UPI0026081790|nr:rhodanese-like domain-containing protein [Acidocella sp.]
MIEDVAPRDVWEALMSDPDAVLVDVRTHAEWNFVGVPELGEAGKQPVLISWTGPVSVAEHPEFLEGLRAAHIGVEAKIYFLCRSGVRSKAAALVARGAGYRHVFNIKDGFEGPLDARGHRGTVAGWKMEGLPWKQG